MTVIPTYPPLEPTGEPNELHPELLAAAALHPFPGTISSPRMQMFLSHIGQALGIKEPTRRRLYTGIEREFGKYVFDIRMPHNGQIIAVIDQHPKVMGRDVENPNTLVIYEIEETREIDAFLIPKFHSLHQHFGFPYVLRPEAIRKLYHGSNIEKDTVFATSPNITEEGDWMFGREANIAFMSIPGVIEDGIVISESFAKKLTTKGYETRSISFGKKYYPLNLYGDENNYKPFPDIGEYIRDDGLVFGRREFSEYLAPVEMTPEALRTPDYIYDDLVYSLCGKAKVIDVNVMRDGSQGPSPTPVGMEPQPSFYHGRLKNYYKRVIEVWRGLARERKDNLRLTGKFHQIVTEALVMQENNDKQKIERMYKLKPLDDWRVEVTFEYDIEPTVAFKGTGIHGNKGVVCAKWKDEDMPIDDNGIRADVIMAPNPIWNRMIPGALYEHYINATTWMVTQEIRRMCSHGVTHESVEAAWTYLLRYLDIVSPPDANLLRSEMYAGTKETTIQEILTEELGLRVWYPPNNPAEISIVIDTLSREFPLNITPVTYRGRSGNMVRTKEPVLIGSSYFMLLEKTGSDFSGVGSGKVQIFGILARLTNYDKYSTPVRPQPVRITDESTMRLFMSVIGEPAAELMEMSNDPATHSHVVDNLLRADKPTAIAKVVDRALIARGRSRAGLYINHVLECQGVEFVKRSDDRQEQKIFYPEEVRTMETYDVGL
jgi:DNA-directed RNA polymerase beta subunit